ncbi:MAG: amino acid permease [Acidobacteriota bacterium]|nr:amino acid permease [Acidobacteriota bacterium]
MAFRRVLRPFDATMVVIGGIIGSGIFINPRLVAQSLDSTALVLAAWVVGGMVALCGAFAYAELGSRFPRAGGQYVYLKDAWHPLAGFLYVWALLLIIETGAMAAVAIIFAEYLLRFLGRDASLALPLAIAALVVVSAINYVGVKPGSRVLNVFVVLKVAALAVLIGIGLLLPAGAGDWLGDTRVTELRTGTGTVLAFGAALIPILFAYGGWQNANYIAEEIDAPERNLPRSLIMGVIVVVIVYVLVNVAYLRLLGLEGLAATATPAADAAARAIGPAGDKFVAAAIAISTFGFLDLAVLAPTRVYYAAAADGYLPSALARLHPRYGTPTLAIAVQAIWAILLVLTGTYGDLLNSVVFADWIFFGMTVAALFAWRSRDRQSSEPANPTHFRSPGYPLLPGFFVLIAAAVVASVIIEAPLRAAFGALLIATGIPVFYYFAGRRT